MGNKNEFSDLLHIRINNTDNYNKDIRVPTLKPKPLLVKVWFDITILLI